VGEKPTTSVTCLLDNEITMHKKSQGMRGYTEILSTLAAGLDRNIVVWIFSGACRDYWETLKKQHLITVMETLQDIVNYNLLG
jgi:hypothetical protein